MAWIPDADEIEGGTGRPGAVVYESPVVGISWLVRRGKNAFAGLDDAAMEAAAINAVEAAHDALLLYGFDSPKTYPVQALAFPASGAYAFDGRLFAPDEIPTDLLEGIRLIEEEIAAGTWMPTAGQGPIKRMEADGSEVEYFSSPDTLEAQHPAIAGKLRRCVP